MVGTSQKEVSNFARIAGIPVYVKAPITLESDFKADIVSKDKKADPKIKYKKNVTATCTLTFIFPKNEIFDKDYKDVKTDGAKTAITDLAIGAGQLIFPGIIASVFADKILGITSGIGRIRRGFAKIRNNKQKEMAFLELIRGFNRNKKSKPLRYRDKSMRMLLSPLSITYDINIYRNLYRVKFQVFDTFIITNAVLNNKKLEKKLIKKFKKSD